MFTLERFSLERSERFLGFTVPGGHSRISYSMVLGERVVTACDEGVDTRAEIAERFSVSESWVRHLTQRRRETRSISPKSRGGVQHLGRRPGAQAVGDHAQKKSLQAAEQDRPEGGAAVLAERVRRRRRVPTRVSERERSDGRHDMPLRPSTAWEVGRRGGACLAFDGATNTACFEIYVAECLVPTFRPGDILVMDNLSCHKPPRSSD